MQRRFVGAVGRRSVRGDGRAAGPPTVPQILASLGADARAWWTVYDPSLPADPGLALTSGEVDTWTDQESTGFVAAALGAGQRPPYAADGSDFAGRSVVQCASTGSRILRGNPLSGNMFDVGEFAWILVVFRIRVTPSAADGCIFSGQDVGALRITCHWENADSSLRGVVAGSTLSLGGSTATNGVTILSVAYDPAGARISSFPGTTLVNTGITSALAGPIDRCCFGAFNIAGNTPSDVSFAELIGVNGWTAARETQLVAALRTKWGF